MRGGACLQRASFSFACSLFCTSYGAAENQRKVWASVMECEVAIVGGGLGRGGLIDVSAFGTLSSNRGKTAVIKIHAPPNKSHTERRHASPTPFAPKDRQLDIVSAVISCTPTPTCTYLCTMWGRGFPWHAASTASVIDQETQKLCTVRTHSYGVNR